MKKYLKDIAIQTATWTFALIYFTMLRQFGQELVDGSAPRSILTYAALYLVIGLVSSIILIAFEGLLSKRLNSIKSFGMGILVRAFLHLIIFIVLITTGTFLYALIINNVLDLDLVTNYLFSKEGILTLSYLFFISFLIQSVKLVDTKFGPGNLFRMLKGEFHSPKEVERIVMFLDLKSSTTIAERIGHIKYSRLIQECFDELGIARTFSAEIYQYVGDEVVLVWEPTKGLNNTNCINFYYAYRQALINKAEHFKSNYGVIPYFKCGCHIGKVVMTEIGQVKREIAYHGDVMNTAARIQSQCNVHNKEFLLSEKLYKLLLDCTSFKFNFIDSVNLKGKINDVKIYDVEKK